MKARSERLERAFRAIDELVKDTPKVLKDAPGDAPGTPLEGVTERLETLLETACTCGKYSFPHIHNREDRHKAIQNWNRDSQHKIAKWIQ